MSAISEFLASAQQVYKTGIAREHAYRPALHDLLKAMGDDLTPVNDPAKSKVGAPDFIVIKDDVAIGHVEAKDIDVDLRGMKGPNKEQQERYRAALPNLVYTNGLDWDFYRDGQLVASVSVGILNAGIQPMADQFEKLENLLKNFVSQQPQTITSPKDLAVRMAGKANLIKDVLKNTLRDDAELQTELSTQYQAFKENLIHDITAEDFADIYAETIAYGMFAARLHDDSPGTFSRQEALELLPKSNPFLRSLFTFVAGYDLDERIAWIIDDLARVFQACDVSKLMEGFGKLTGQNDPFLHFYETFLAAYNPAKRKARGVWYTPEPVVNFIVRAVDQVLQTEFGLAEGLADTSKVSIDWETGQTDKKGKPIIIKKDVHRVQILDPATGTGTFLAEVIKQIAPKVQGVAPGMWSQYIEKDLIPRLHGFELLMASYAMCHMKLDMILTELGYKPAKEPPRLSVFLTNSLEEGEPANQTLPFTQWLSREAKGANTIKRDMPIMCVIGNPPYSVSSTNKGDWITGILADYKQGLNERKINLDDDYIKFIRFAQAMVEKNGRGVVGFITNNSFLDGVTHRKMREILLRSFSKIHIVDLHGSTKRKEVSPDGTPDVNVFDIMQGVSITILVKKGTTEGKLADVYHTDIHGIRAAKYDWLSTGTIPKDASEQLAPEEPYYYFTKRRWVPSAYDDLPSVMAFFESKNSGIQSKRDAINVGFSKAEIQHRIDDLKSMDADAFREKYRLPKDGRDWSVGMATADIASNDLTIVPYNYRPFDTRYIPYTGQTKGIVSYPRATTSDNMLRGSNVSLCVCRQLSIESFAHVFCTDLITDLNSVSINSKEQTYFAPLYLYPGPDELDQSRKINLNEALFARMKALGTRLDGAEPGPQDVFDYIYGVLHAPLYREKYAEYLKIDFARIPWPAAPEEFWHVAEKGAKLRQLHLLDLAGVGVSNSPFKGQGDNLITAPRHEMDRVWINDGQYFEGISHEIWQQTIGGYQPAFKWLKDRRGRTLSFDDVKHYQLIVRALAETHTVSEAITLTLP